MKTATKIYEYHIKRGIILAFIIIILYLCTVQNNKANDMSF